MVGSTSCAAPAGRFLAAQPSGLDDLDRHAFGVAHEEAVVEVLLGLESELCEFGRDGVFIETLDRDREMIDDLARAIQDAVAIDVTAELNALVSKLEALDVTVADRIKGLDSCTLVTGHDELGYFAERYGCTVVGAVIPSFSTTAEATAGELADLESLVRDYDVPAIFTGIGTSSDVVEMLSSTLGVPAIELSTHYMSGVSTYEEFITRLVDQIVGGLS